MMFRFGEYQRDDNYLKVSVVDASSYNTFTVVFPASFIALSWSKS